MSDPFDVDLTDADLMGEVEMTAALMVAASSSVGSLTQAEVDRLLGVRAPEAP